MNHSESTSRQAALACLETFATRILPGTVRRIARWKHILPSELPDLMDDLRQELAVDCLQNPELVVHLATAPRHRRWMQLAERWVYHQRFGHRRSEPVADDQPAPLRESTVCETAVDRDSVIAMGNGRVNLTASAAHNRQQIRSLQDQVEMVATQLGCGARYHAFWQTRLAEAMTGLAADLLRDRGAVRPLRPARSAPDPKGRLRRIRRVAARFHVRPSTIEVRRLLRVWLKKPPLDANAPRRLLEQAAQLCPTKSSTWLWLFEANLANGDLAGAMRAIRVCRRLPGTARLGITLARARLLEARGRWAGAVALLRRARRRWPFEARWHLVPKELTAG